MLTQCFDAVDRKGIRPVRTLHQNLLAIVVDISGRATGCIPYGNPPACHRNRGATGSRFAWKVAVKTVYVYTA